MKLGNAHNYRLRARAYTFVVSIAARTSRRCFGATHRKSEIANQEGAPEAQGYK